ncbi:MAG: hypothetical protein K6G09_00345 [Treponema sp.]|nr:hypothetical protein [Treponema sp.]
MASIGDINNLQDKENLDIGLVPTHYFDAQGNKRNIAEDVAAIYQAINGKADSSQVGQAIGQLTQAVNSKADASHTHGTGDITGLDNTLNGLGSSIGNINASLEHKADESHKHVGSDIKYEHTDEINFSKNANDSYSSTVYFNYRDGYTDNVNSQNLISTYRFCNRNGTTVGVTLQAEQFTGNAATATNADKVDGYHILVNQTVTARTDAIFFL